MGFAGLGWRMVLLGSVAEDVFSVFFPVIRENGSNLTALSANQSASLVEVSGLSKLSPVFRRIAADVHFEIEPESWRETSKPGTHRLFLCRSIQRLGSYAERC